MMKVFRRWGKKLNGVKLPSVPRLSRVKLVWLLLVGAVIVVGLLVWLSQGQVFPLLQTRGEIANRQRDLLIFATMLALLVLVPVYFMLFSFAWRYRAGHKKEYKPEWDTHKGYEALWWGIPIAIIGVLAVVTWVTSHSLDPFKPLTSTQKPLKVQVVALQWKWLFIYPEENVASIGEVAFPAGRPVEFTMTSDAPMNSFWIPQLAGQIYVMSGMSTKLHVSADAPGNYEGLTANISGKGFADMRFTAKAMTLANYDFWVKNARLSSAELDIHTYDTLARPSTTGVKLYRLGNADIYEHAIMKYMGGHAKPMLGSNEVNRTEDNVSSPVKTEESNNPEKTNPVHNMNTMQGMHMEGM